MIHIISGRPGAGKTLWTVTKGIELVGQGREVYELGFAELNHEATGIKPFPYSTLADWMKLPPGSVLIVDEAQRTGFLPSRGTSAAAPAAWIEEFSRVRHFAIDVYLITQHPQFLEAFVRRVASYHSHFVRVEGGLNKSIRYYTDGMLQNVEKAEAQAPDSEGFDFPVQNFALYKSASVHTIKKRIPRRVVMAAAGAVALALLLVFGFMGVNAITSRIGKDKPEEHAQAEKPAQTRPAGGGIFASFNRAPAVPEAPVRRYATAEEYFAAMQPKVPGLPWTAPFYEGREAEAPDLACIASEDRCTCITVPQGTRYPVKEPLCRQVAKQGIFNPYKVNHQGERRTLATSR